jgi:hypothetical protein
LPAACGTGSAASGHPFPVASALLSGANDKTLLISGFGMLLVC